MDKFVDRSHTRTYTHTKKRTIKVAVKNPSNTDQNLTCSGDDAGKPNLEQKRDQTARQKSIEPIAARSRTHRLVNMV